MTDKIQEAIESHEANQERMARGTINGHMIYVIKVKRLLGWQLRIDVDNSVECKTRGNKSSIEADFQHYKNKYSLEVVD